MHLSKKETGILWTYVDEEKGLPGEGNITEGSTPGSSTRGRNKMTWLDNIRSWTRLSLTELVTNVEDRHQWRNLVHDAANPRSEDG